MTPTGIRDRSVRVRTQPLLQPNANVHPSMKSQETDPQTPDLEAEHLEAPDNGLPSSSGHARMPWFLLAIWVASIFFYAWYLSSYAMPDLKEWLAR
jgi:hypothetical protein